MNNHRVCNWIDYSTLPEGARHILKGFLIAFDLPSGSFVVTKATDELVFLQVPGQRVSPYHIANFIKCTRDIYLEILAIDRNVFEFRLFCSKWAREHNLPLHFAYALKPESDVIHSQILMNGGTHETQ